MKEQTWSTIQSMLNRTVLGHESYAAQRFCGSEGNYFERFPSELRHAGALVNQTDGWKKYQSHPLKAAFS